MMEVKVENVEDDGQEEEVKDLEGFVIDGVDGQDGGLVVWEGVGVGEDEEVDGVVEEFFVEVVVVVVFGCLEDDGIVEFEVVEGEVFFIDVRWEWGFCGWSKI